MRDSRAALTRPLASPQRRRHTAHACLGFGLALALASSGGGARAGAEDATQEQMHGLDEQVQEIKSDVLAIAAELDQLEEKLLYPSGTQVAVFVSLAGGEPVQLDSVQVQIDGEAVARHVYTFDELEALRKGGVQRIYTGNVTTGEHLLEVSLTGKLPGGADLAAVKSLRFVKDVEPKLVDITLATDGSDADRIRFEER